MGFRLRRHAIALTALLTSVVVPRAVPARQAGAWQPAAGPLMTRWAKDVSPDRALPEYPRPQLVRPDWRNLNGLWDYAIRPRADAEPGTFDGRMLVPFPVESALSDVMKKVGEANRLWYHRTFEVPAGWRGRRTLLHFGAVDWEATVWVNGVELGTHRGGYGAFTFDITKLLKPDGPQELTVAVWDPTDAGTQPRGKQVASPHGIWYTSVTGIWQTVWLEPVPETAVESLVLVPDVDRASVHVTAAVSGPADGVSVIATVFDGSREVADGTGRPGEPFMVPIADARLWSPASPHLYQVKVALHRGGSAGAALDDVSSYFGMRKISLCSDAGGITRLCLNNVPVFEVGPLDQGWWPDGLYTAPTDDALRSDIETIRRLGFNMARKHVKVEPDRWYYWADTLGLLVWQDMPSTVIRGARSPESAEEFEAELRTMIDQRRDHPSIVMWVPFNEGWGQYDTPRIVSWIKSYDPSRLVDDASGWTDEGVGDVHDMHSYPGPGSPKPEAHRAAVLGEFGGLGLPVPGHTWQNQANWSYRGFTTRDALTDAYVALVGRVHPLIGSPGLSAAVYTQMTDVEIEVNGLMSYDRAMVKPDEARVRAANLALFTPPPVEKTILATSRDTPATWRYTMSRPPDSWMASTFDAAAWQEGPGGFGTRDTPGAVVRTTWNTSDIWLRRTFDLPAALRMVDPQFLLHHDEDAEVYVNGVLALTVTGYTSDYQLEAMSAAARALLKPGRNVLAVHCHQTSGGQYIDVGIVDLVARAPRSPFRVAPRRRRISRRRTLGHFGGGKHLRPGIRPIRRGELPRMAFWKRNAANTRDNAPDPSLPLIRLEAVTKVFEGDADEPAVALRDVTVDIDRGEYISVSGPSGCGKSTFLSILALLDTPTTGRYWLKGRPVDGLSPGERAHTRNVDIGLVFQSFNLIADMSVYENVEYPLTLRGAGAAERQARVAAALDRVGLTARAKQRPSHLSGGHQQLVAIARAIAGQPPIVLADEPTGNLDSAAGEIVMQALADLHAGGSTICLATHDPRYIALAHRHIYLFDGRVVDHPET
jgi:ABC-type lipoprotein export system ATPase subunit